MENFFSKNLKYLRTKKGINQSQFADLVGKGYTTISNWENGASWPNFEDLNTIIKYFEVNAHDLLFTDLENAHLNFKKSQFENSSKCASNHASNFSKQGIDQSLSQSKEQHQSMPKIVTLDPSGNENIILIPIKARAGYLASYKDTEYIHSLPVYSIPGLKNGTYRMFEVSGHSMHPTFYEKDIVLCKWIENQAHIVSNKVYVVVTKEDGIVIKRILKPSKNTNKLVLTSDNNSESNNYPPITVEASQIIEIWEFKALISEHLKTEIDPLKEIQSINYRLTVLESEIKNLSKK